MGKFFKGEQLDQKAVSSLEIGILGYGNQGRAWSLNLRDADFSVTVGTADRESAGRAREDGFTPTDIETASENADMVAILVPDEVIPDLFRQRVRPCLRAGDTLVFASGYAPTFTGMDFPRKADVIMVAPRMIGVGVRERFLSGEGFYCFVGVERDGSGIALGRALGLAGARGAGPGGAVIRSLEQEAVLDLFMEQGFGAALGASLVSAASVLLESGIPPEAVLLELYMSGEMEQVFRSMREEGAFRQVARHSLTSQYGSMTRVGRFLEAGIVDIMRGCLEDITTGRFAGEWNREREKGYPTLSILRELAESNPLLSREEEVRNTLGLDRDR